MASVRQDAGTEKSSSWLRNDQITSRSTGQSAGTVTTKIPRSRRIGNQSGCMPSNSAGSMKLSSPRGMKVGLLPRFRLK